MMTPEKYLKEQFDRLVENEEIKENYNVEVVWKYEDDNSENSDHLANLTVESHPEDISDEMWINLLYGTQDNISDKRKISIVDVSWDNDLEEKKMTQAEIEALEDEDEVEKIERKIGWQNKCKKCGKVTAHPMPFKNFVCNKCKTNESEVYESIQYGDKFLKNTERWLEHGILGLD